MMDKFAAQLEATLYVFGQRLAARAEKGQTTAEYIGIVAFVAALVVIFIGFKTEIADAAKGIITSAFDAIKGAM